MDDPITQAVVQAARWIPFQLLDTIARAAKREQHWTPAVRQRLIDATPAADVAALITPLLNAWEDAPGTPGVVVSAALRAAGAATSAERRGHAESLVWTGPQTDEIGFRSTRAVLHSLIATAEQSLILVSYASYGVDDLVDRLATAADQGVEITLILETRQDGGLTFDASTALSGLKDRASFYHWPLDQRDPRFAKSATMHAKCAVRDRTEALVTSANLTGAAINDNIELGVLLGAGPLPAKIHDHFTALIDAGILERDE